MNTNSNRVQNWRAVLTGLAIASLTSACEVVNPGPVGDAYIALPASQQGLINGSWERLNNVIGNYTYHTAMAAREFFHGGQTGSYGHNANEQAGSFGNGSWSQSGPYPAAQQARWIAEEAIRQFEARGDVDNAMMTKAYLAAGYANRMNGDFFCWGVIDGGPLVPGKHYWERAEGHFTKALALAPDNTAKFSALAGRAQARLQLGDYAGAQADAAQVPIDFEIFVEMDFSKSGATGQRNHVFWAQADSPFRSWTTYHSYYHNYYAQTGDPRVPWAPFPSAAARLCLGGLQGYANNANAVFGGTVPGHGGNGVECFQQKKYADQDADISLASGPEMRLIEAEAMLRQNSGNWQAAMTKINENRVRYIGRNGQALTPWSANNLDDAWTYLMRERGIELWLEARRFADMRRWEPLIIQYGTYAADGQTVLPLAPTTPGTIDWPRYEEVMINKTTNLFTSTQRGREAIDDQSIPRELCYNISTTERDNNPNLARDIDGEP
jgi:tetratricopeptide (TPR) repeat protein